MLSPKIANANPHAAKADVRVRVTRTIVQIEREDARIRVIVPITAAKRSAARGGESTLYLLFIFFLLTPSMLQKTESFGPLMKDQPHLLQLDLISL